MRKNLIKKPQIEDKDNGNYSSLLTSKTNKQVLIIFPQNLLSQILGYKHNQ